MNATGYTTPATGSSGGVVVLNSTTGAYTAGTATTCVSFPTYAAAASLSACVSIVVADLDPAVLLYSSVGFGNVNSPYLVNASFQLNPIACTGVYETGVLTNVVATLTNKVTKARPARARARSLRRRGEADLQH